MYHSITFGEKNTWEDWHLVPSSRPVFNPPKVKEKQLDILGGNGIIDLSESLTGYPLYNNREGSFDFIVMNGYAEWSELYSEITDYLHGYKMKAVLEDDNLYYYEGRFSVNTWKSDKYYSTITIDYNVAPYKRKIESVNLSLPITTQKTKKTLKQNIYGTEPVCPVLQIQTNSGTGTTVTFLNTRLNIQTTKILDDGEYHFPEIIMYGDHVSFTITGQSEGSLALSYEYGRL